MKNLVVTLPNKDSYVRNGQDLSYKKEMVRAWSYIKNDTEIIVVCWYMGRSSASSVVYCSIWVATPGIYFSGTGKAGGSGYDKGSAAFQEACESAGISISPSISGVGESAIKEVLSEIGRILGYPNGLIVCH
jgi:rhodanese-related sulfurtransferase